MLTLWFTTGTSYHDFSDGIITVPLEITRGVVDPTKMQSFRDIIDCPQFLSLKLSALLNLLTFEPLHHFYTKGVKNKTHSSFLFSLSLSVKFFFLYQYN